MEEKKQVLFLLDIYDFLDSEDSLLIFFNPKGKKIILKARSFQKAESKNRIKFNKFSFLTTEYFLYEKETNRGFLKRGDLFLSSDLKNGNMFKFTRLIFDLLRNEEEIDIAILLFIIFVYKNYQKGINFENLTYFFLSLFLKNRNINFAFDHCANCGSKENLVTFLMYRGGMICKNCIKEKEPILEKQFLEKIYNFFMIKNGYKISEINFIPFEDKYLKESFKNYFENELGMLIKI